jgi:hypothetical protein
LRTSGGTRLRFECRSHGLNIPSRRHVSA